MRRTQAATGAIVANVVFALLMLRTTPTDPEPPPMEAQLYDDDGYTSLLPTDAQSKAPPCAHTYFGVGYQYGIRDGHLYVLGAPERLPAYAAGVRVGDEVLALSEDQTRPGQEAVIIVNRRGIVLKFKTLTAQICFEGGYLP